MICRPHTPDSAVGIVNAFGTSIVVKVSAPIDSSPGYAKRMLLRLTEAWKDSPAPHTKQSDLPEIDLGEVNDNNFERVHSRMSTTVTLSALKHHSGDLLMFHAGGLAKADGRVAVITGTSGRGKTTTLVHLGQHYAYVSDETVAISANGEVHPYRKPLSVITEGYRHKLQISPSALGLRPLPEAPLKLGSIAVLERAPEGIAYSTVTPLGFAAGIAAVIEQSSYLADLDMPLARVAETAASVGGFKTLTVGVPERVHLVAEQLFASAAAPQWIRIMPEKISLEAQNAAYLPSNVLDAVECEDGTVVLTHDRQAVLLDGIGPELWRAACAAENWEQLISRVEEIYGPAPDCETRQALEQAAEKLISAGLLLAGDAADSVSSS